MKKLISLTTPLLLLGLLTMPCACTERERNAKRFATLDAVDRDTVPVLKDFRSLYPDSTVRYLSFAGADFPSLSANAGIHGRYTLNLRVPVFYSADNKSVLRYGDPEFFLCEVTRIQLEGEVVRAYDAGDQQWHFGGDVWKQVFDAGGDFGVVGYALKKEVPVKNFKALIASIEETARLEAKQAEEGGADHPAAVPESKLEGEEKPQPESKGRSQ